MCIALEPQFNIQMSKIGNRLTEQPNFKRLCYAMATRRGKQQHKTAYKRNFWWNDVRHCMPEIRSAGLNFHRIFRAVHFSSFVDVGCYFFSLLLSCSSCCSSCHYGFNFQIYSNKMHCVERLHRTRTHVYIHYWPAFQNSTQFR